MKSETYNQRLMTNNTDGLLHDACIIIEEAQKKAYCAVNETLIKRNWLLGMRIRHEVLNEKRAEYGEQVIKELAKRLTEIYGKGFSMRSLYNFVNFYQTHGDLFVLKTNTNILQALPAKLSDSHLTEILQALHAKSPTLLSWTHYVILQQVNNSDAREWVFKILAFSYSATTSIGTNTFANGCFSNLISLTSISSVWNGMFTTYDALV